MNDLSKIEEIYHAALEKPPPERDEFLKKSCGDNRELRREVESLLSFEKKAESFIESPPEDLAADLFEKRGENHDIIGKTLHHYHILSLLGEGGMGEVYLAEDTKLGRKLAVKLLPSQFSDDDERKQRFLREARAVSALNHPNILTVHGIEETDEHDFIVTEFIDGKTLREKISENPLDWRDALDIAVQIADALESAHSIGIIHRDIKPANIMIRRDGYVKILDFGLAKMTNRTNGAENFKTIDKTGNRRVMGTMNYMSPEQTLGEKVDSRTDIFSFGVVLYEMLSGIQPFAGASDAAVYNATINADPTSLTEIKPDVPPAFEQIIKRSIEKDANERYQTVSEMRSDLQTLKQNSASDSSGFKNYSFQKPRRTKLFAPIAAAVLVLLATIIYFSFFANKTATDAPEVAKNLSFTKFTGSGDISYPNFSPDGKTVIFSSRAEGNWDIYFQRVSGENAINITKDSTANDFQAAYSPDGGKIAFHSDRDGGGLFLMGATGENVRRISDTGFHPSWSPDGTEIVFSNATFELPGERYQVPAEIWTVNVATGEKRKIETDGDAIQPSWSPNGTRIAFWSIGEKRSVKTVSTGGGDALALTDDTATNWNPVWSPDGKYLYYASNSGGSMNFWRIPIDEKSGKKLGAAEPFTMPSAYSGNLAFSSDGKNIAFVQTTNSADIIQAKLDPQTETADQKTVSLTGSIGKYNRSPFVSPDGEFVSFDAIKDKQEDIYIMRKDGGGVRQLTNDIYRDRGAVWSPDGKKLMFFSDRSGEFGCWTIDADGTNLKQITPGIKPYGILCLWSPDGKRILENGTGIEPRIFSTDKPLGEQTPFKMQPFYENGDYIQITSWSPDGDKVGGWRVSKIAGKLGVVYYSLSEKKYTEVADYGESPSWLSDSRRLIFFEKNRVFLHDTATGKTKEILTMPQNTGIQLLDVAPDDRSFYFALRKSESNIWLAAVE